MDTSSVALTLLISATLAFFILFVLFVVVAVDIGERRSTKRRITTLENVLREMFEDEERPPVRPGSPEPGSPGGPGIYNPQVIYDHGHQWVRWHNLEELQALPDALLAQLSSIERCCNLSTVEAGWAVCTLCGHTQTCGSLTPHMETGEGPQEDEGNGKL